MTDFVWAQYFTSSFLNRSIANRIKHNLKVALSDLNTLNMVQVFMDDLNVNQKFTRDLKAELEENSKGHIPVLLNMGNCGLHVLCGAFKTAIKATNWSLINFLWYLYNLFIDVPTCCALFMQYLNFNMFPLKFCPVRWLQNGNVAQHALDIISHLIYVASKEDNIAISSTSFHTVCSLIDPRLEAKLTFFKSLIAEIGPFLGKYQTDVSFLHRSLQCITVNVMRQFIKEKVLNENTAIQKVDFANKENILPATDIISVMLPAVL